MATGPGQSNVACSLTLDPEISREKEFALSLSRSLRTEWLWTEVTVTQRTRPPAWERIRIQLGAIAVASDCSRPKSCHIQVSCQVEVDREVDRRDSWKERLLTVDLT